MGGHDILARPDQELLRSMLVELETYRSGRGPFPGLVSALDVGIDALVGCDPAFVEALRAKWQILEEINALALEQGKLHPLEGDTTSAERAIRDFLAAIKAHFPAVVQESGS